MIRNLKSLGLALVAVFAMSAVAASAVHGAAFESSGSANGRTSITALNHEGKKDKFVVGEAAVECGVTRAQGTATEASVPSMTMTVTYEECKFGGSNAAVRMNHCAYVFYAETTETAGTGQKHGKVEVECEAGSKIEVEAAGFCTMKIGAQTPKDGISYAKVKTGSKEELTATVTAKEVTVAEKTGPFCFLVANKGNYEGIETVKGYEDTAESAPTGTEKTTPETVKEGSQVNITKS